MFEQLLKQIGIIDKSSTPPTLTETEINLNIIRMQRKAEMFRLDGKHPDSGTFTETFLEGMKVV